MISRIWHGRTRPENAAAYERLLRTEILPSIARKVPGYRGAHLLRRDDGDEVEFVTVTWFESLGASSSAWLTESMTLNAATCCRWIFSENCRPSTRRSPFLGMRAT